MDFYGQSQLVDKRKQFRLVANGFPTTIVPMLIHENFKWDELCEKIVKTMEITGNYNELRIFKSGGVQIFSDDCRYLQNEEILYVSLGSDFDDSSNFAVYKVMQILGEGGFGKTIQVVSGSEDDRLIINKQIQRQVQFLNIFFMPNLENVQDISMMYKEIHILMGLNHQNILRVHNCFDLNSEQKLAIVLEYLAGGTLREYIKKKGCLEQSEALVLFKQIIEAIQYCHREKVIHRDLKLENIMFTDNETQQVQVVDFGISGFSSNINIQNTDAGSIQYFAPEVLISHAPAHPSIDIWAMGVILYWMVHGGPPFNGSQKQEIYNKIQKCEYKIDSKVRSRVSPQLIDLISQMLIIDVNQRITISEITQHDWMTSPFYKKFLENKDLDIELDNSKIEGDESFCNNENDESLRNILYKNQKFSRGSKKGLNLDYLKPEDSQQLQREDSQNENFIIKRSSLQLHKIEERSPQQLLTSIPIISKNHFIIKNISRQLVAPQNREQSFEMQRSQIITSYRQELFILKFHFIHQQPTNSTLLKSYNEDQRNQWIENDRSKYLDCQYGLDDEEAQKKRKLQFFNYRCSIKNQNPELSSPSNLNSKQNIFIEKSMYQSQNSNHKEKSLQPLPKISPKIPLRNFNMVNPMDRSPNRYIIPISLSPVKQNYQ